MKPHKIRSVFSKEMLDPPQWTKEIIDLEYTEPEIISIIKIYELYIALILRSLQHIHKINDFYDWSINIIEESKEWIYNNIENTTFIEIYEFLTTFINDFDWGIYKDKENTKKCYAYINNLIRYCFYPVKKGKTLNISTYIKDYHKNIGLESNKAYINKYKYADGIKIFYFNNVQFAEIKLLIEYFARLKYNLKIKNDEKFILKQLVKKENDDNQFIMLINWVEVIISNTFMNDNSNIYLLINEIIKGNEDIKNMLNDLGKENSDKLKDLMIELTRNNNEDIKKILKDIKHIIETSDYKLHHNKPNKILFLIEFNCFKETLEILIEKKYIINDELSDTFLWNYKNIIPTKKGRHRVQDSNQLLAFLFLDFYYIQKLIINNEIYKEKGKDIDFFQYGKLFLNTNNCKTINLAFKITKLEDCKADVKRKIPEAYANLLNDLGILNKSNIASTQKIKKIK